MIEIGQKVYSKLHGGRHGLVYAIHGEQRPESIGTMAHGVISFGGSAAFDIVFDDGTESRQLPESILYGVQWKIFPDVASADELHRMREFAASEKARKEIEAKKNSDDFAVSVAALKVDQRYAALQQTGQGAQFSKLVAINLRRELKTAFPLDKFSVKCSGYDSVTVAWTDGPTKESVEAITRKYSGGYFDGMEDMYHHQSSPWTTVFGSAKYMTIQRTHSPEAMTRAVEAVSKDFGWSHIEVRTSYDGGARPSTSDRFEEEAIYDFLEHRRKYADIAA